MSSLRAPHCVAILDTNTEIVGMLRILLEKEGFSVVSIIVEDIKRGHEDLLKAIQKYDPRVIIYDLPPPYRETVVFLRLLQALEPMRGRKFVFMTTNEQALREESGFEGAIETRGNPSDIDEIVEATIQASRGSGD